MVTSAPVSSTHRRPFDALDAEWASLCRRHRRHREIVAGWARQEPVLSAVTRLGDVVPPRGVDRRPWCQALGRLAAGGDDLAARAVLQLLVPGMVRIALRWRWWFRGIDAAGWEVIARVGLYIARLRETEVTTSVAGWVLRSVDRDLVDDIRRDRRAVPVAAVDVAAADTGALTRSHAAPSAEDAAIAGPLVWHAVSDAVRRGAVDRTHARIVLLDATGHSLLDHARRTGTARATIYRHRDRGHADLRDHLADAA